MERTIEEVSAKLVALGAWEGAAPFHWAVKPRGSAVPYFCSIELGGHEEVRARLLLLEGWQTFHDYVQHRLDGSYGFYLSPMEMPHFELVALKDGSSRFFRHDPGYMPCEPPAARRALCARVLWEVYGLLLRLEDDPRLPLRYVEERAVFARVEGADGAWADAPLEIPAPRPHVERVSFPKGLVAKAKDLPFEAEERLDVDLTLALEVMTRERRPRCAYRLLAVDPKTGARVVDELTSVVPDLGLRGVWEGMPPRLLERLVARGRIPGEIRLRSPRVFRLLRPLGLEVPVKLSLHDRLPSLEATPPARQI